jgi:hypothetical protein
LLLLVGVYAVATNNAFRTGKVAGASCSADAIGGGDGSAARPIIPEVLADPKSFMGRCVVLSGRVIERNDRNLVIDDIALRPIAVVLRESALISFKNNDRLLMVGTVRIENGKPVFHAEHSKVDAFLGGGCC